MISWGRFHRNHTWLVDTCLYGHILLLMRSIAAPSIINPQDIHFDPVSQDHANLYHYPPVETTSTQSTGSACILTTSCFF